MISEKLKQKFELLETIAFTEYGKADKKSREHICKELGEYEGREILKEIGIQVNQHKN